MNRVLELERRIDHLCARAADPDPGTAILLEIEDVLCQGYVLALELDAQIGRLEAEARELAPQADDAAAAVRMRELLLRSRSDAAAAERLRDRLAALRDHLARLGGGRIGLT